jgi:hypothetical protein
MGGAFDDLLCSFGSLEELECSYIWAPYVNWKFCLDRHPRLKKLLVSSMQLSDGWPNRTETIAEILASCPTVQNFAYSPPTPYFGYIESCELRPLCPGPSTNRSMLLQQLLLFIHSVSFMYLALAKIAPTDKTPHGLKRLLR